jgi:hypothetical protein
MGVNDMKNLYSFNQAFGRMGHIEGTFRATPEEVLTVIGKTAYFGEVLGKHSEIYCDLNTDNIKLVTKDEEFLGLADKLGIQLDTGFNPLQYLQEDQE